MLSRSVWSIIEARKQFSRVRWNSVMAPSCDSLFVDLSNGSDMYLVSIQEQKEWGSERGESGGNQMCNCGERKLIHVCLSFVRMRACGRGRQTCVEQNGYVW